MNKKMVSGCILSTTLLILLSIAPTIYADIDTISIDIKPDSDTYDYDGYTPIKLVFLLISKLLYHKDIQMVDSVDDVEQLVEHDAEISGIFGELMSYNFGCEEGSTLDWNYLFNIIIYILYLIIIGYTAFIWYLFEIIPLSFVILMFILVTFFNFDPFDMPPW